MLACSCSARTLQQIAVLQSHGHPSFQLDARRTQDPLALAGDALRWFDELDTVKEPLFFSSLPPAELRAVQLETRDRHSVRHPRNRYGAHRSRVARQRHGAGHRRRRRDLGAVVTALGIQGAIIGAEIARVCPGSTRSTRPDLAPPEVGNFGEVRFLAEALEETVVV
ncbi:nucleotide-binding domain containing protein [Arthrobacter methylotrophus]|uniref:nucleotide-binding domain containing protein n=1 Tax=Arthrobacter methylotrophus TaxID=121291 RepID=UPI003CD07FBE